MILLFLSLPLQELQGWSSILRVQISVWRWLTLSRRVFVFQLQFYKLGRQISSQLIHLLKLLFLGFLPMARRVGFLIPLLLSPYSVFLFHFPIEVKFASTSKASIWIWSRVRDFLSLRVNPNFGSKTTLAAACGGLVSIGRLLYNLLNVFMNSKTSSLCFFSLHWIQWGCTRGPFFLWICPALCAEFLPYFLTSHIYCNDKLSCIYCVKATRLGHLFLGWSIFSVHVWIYLCER